MADTRTPEQRRRIMQAVGAKDTKPELIVRRMLFGMGYRYRLHVKKLPGSPDIVFPRRRKALFVHGCFWHGHGCKIGKLPKSKLDYWQPKIAQNRERDCTKASQLEAMGWSVGVIWQCEVRNGAELSRLLTEFLEDGTG